MAKTRRGGSPRGDDTHGALVDAPVARGGREGDATAGDAMRREEEGAFDRGTDEFIVLGDRRRRDGTATTRERRRTAGRRASWTRARERERARGEERGGHRVETSGREAVQTVTPFCAGASTSSLAQCDTRHCEPLGESSNVHD